MSVDNVWEQKHAATSSIKSSDLLAGTQRYEINLNRCHLTQWYEPTENGFKSMSKSTEYTPDGHFVKETVLEGRTWEWSEPETPTFLDRITSAIFG